MADQRIERLKTTLAFRRTVSLSSVEPDVGFGQLGDSSSPSSGISARKLLESRQFDGSASPTARSLTIQTSPIFTAAAPNGPKVLASLSRSGGMPSEYTTVSDRIGGAYTPTAAGLNKAKASTLAAALGHNGGKPGKSSREMKKRVASQRLFNQTEHGRSIDIMSRSLGPSSPMLESAGLSHDSLSQSGLLSPFDRSLDDKFADWDPMMRSRNPPPAPGPSNLSLESPTRAATPPDASANVPQWKLRGANGLPTPPPPLPPARIAEVRAYGVDTAAGSGLRAAIPSLPPALLEAISRRSTDPCPRGCPNPSASLKEEVRELYLDAAAKAVVMYELLGADSGLPVSEEKLALARAGSGMLGGVEEVARNNKQQQAAAIAVEAVDEASTGGGGGSGGSDDGDGSGSDSRPSWGSSDSLLQSSMWTNPEYQLGEWRVDRQTGIDHAEVLASAMELRRNAHGTATSYPVLLQRLWQDERRKRSQAELRGAVFSNNDADPALALINKVNEEEEDEAEEAAGSVDGGVAALAGGVEGLDSPERGNNVPQATAIRRKSRVVRIEPPPPVVGDVCSLALVPVDDPTFRAALPLPILELTRSLRRGARASLGMLEKHWLPAATQIVHDHMRRFPHSEHLSQPLHRRLVAGAGDDLVSAKGKGGKARSPRVIQPEKQALLSSSSVRFEEAGDHSPDGSHSPNFSQQQQHFRRGPVEGGTALMARQLRESTQRALDSFVNFFERFDDATVAGTNGRGLAAGGTGNAPDTAILVEMHILPSEGSNNGAKPVVSITPSLDEIQEELSECMYYLVEAVQDFPCIEAPEGSPHAGAAAAAFDFENDNGGAKLDGADFEDEPTTFELRPRFERKDTIVDSTGFVDSFGGGKSNKEPFSPMSPSMATVPKPDGSGFEMRAARPPRFDVLRPGSMTCQDEGALAAVVRVRNALNRHFAMPAALVAEFQGFAELVDGRRETAVAAVIAKRGRGEDTGKGLHSLEDILGDLEELDRAIDAVGGHANAEALGACRLVNQASRAKAAAAAAAAAAEGGDAEPASPDDESSVAGEDDGSGANLLSERFVHYPLFTVDLLPAKDELHRIVRVLRDQVIEAAVEDQRQDTADATERYEAMVKRLLLEPVTSEELKDLADYHVQCPASQDVLMDEYSSQLMERHRFLLHSGHYVYPRKDMLAAADLWTWPAKIDGYLATSLEMYARCKDNFLTLARGEQMEFDKLIDGMQAKLAQLSDIHSLAPVEVERAYKMADLIGANFDKADRICDVVQSEEALLGLTETDNRSILTAVQQELDPLRKLWAMGKQHVENDVAWLQQPLATVNAEEAERTAGDMLLTITKLSKQLVKAGPARAAAARVAKQINTEVKELMDSTIPLMALICTQGLQERHWEAMEGATGTALPHDMATTVRDMLEVGLQHHVVAIEDTCVAAQKEAALVKVLDKMETDWEGMVFGTKEWRTGMILAGVDEIQLVLDDQIVKAQAMKGSRFVKPYIERVNAWEHDLVTMQDILDNWLKVQSTWLYLEPIFSSDDIMRQMPEEGKLFKQVDAVYRAAMDETKANGDCLMVARRAGLLDELVSANTKLDIISKGLSDYLRTKMLAFPRFFFLSNDELLEILAETKDPTKVQPHLKKCFEGMAQVQFEKNLDITSCYDAMKEQIPFDYAAVDHWTRQGKQVINPKDSGGNVELWLVEVEIMMKKSIAHLIDLSMIAYQNQPRLDWIIQWQGQVVLAGNQTMWTHFVEDAIANGTVYELGEKLQDALMETVLLVRGNLSKAHRTSIGALIVLDVHNRDSTRELAELKITKTTDFDWQAQLRYYHDASRASALSGVPESLICAMINARVAYAYEYLGNGGRLVITPLTDRCYRTLLGAIQLNLGGAPEGPAGTGKTETTKDLAKSIAIQCVVFNCSDSLDYRAMGKFFMGLASSGAWACFDEFNRITLEVLSVVAQQVQCIQIAKLKKQDIFDFEGTTLGLKHTCCPFITMNPGYAGRAELPDNLKVLFRTVAMMVPDYAMIGEISLYSFGYEDAKAMAVKIVTTYKLCSEQLSSQSHYDYGMRAVIAVLRAAGNLKRSDGHLSEDILVLRSIIDVNLCKFLAPDVPLFNGITSDLFPGVSVPPPDRSLFKSAFEDVTKVKNIQANDYLYEKVVQTYDMMVVRHGFMIVGSPFAGKTVNWSGLASTLALLHKRMPEDPEWTNVLPLVMNPKSVTMGQLYGCFDPVSHEWTDGVLAILFRNAASNKIGMPEDRKWVLFDGPVDAIWIENMNTVLDDNKKLCLMSGEIIAMSDVMTMMFEPMDLLVASPATVSRCGMVYMEPEQMGWKCLSDSWVDKFSGTAYINAMSVEEAPTIDAVNFGKNATEPEPGQLRTKFVFTEGEATYVRALCAWLIEPCMCFVRRELSEMAPTGDSQLVTGLLRLMECTLEDSIGGQDPAKPEVCDDAKVMARRKSQIECAFLFGLIWSVGCSSDQQHKFSNYLMEILGDIDAVEKNHPATFTALQVKKWAKPEFGDTEILDGTLTLPCPAGGEDFTHDFVYLPNGDGGKGEWKLWTQTLEKTEIPNKAPFASITVPTAATAKVGFLLKLLVTRHMKVCVCGPTGTGKSVYIFDTITKGLDQDLYKPVILGFSAKTSANMTQDIVDGKLMKRRKGVFGPPMGSTAIIFVDDLNMPEVETYGAQPPIELLRQCIGNGGWYDLKEKTWRTITDCVLVSAMGPPGGGRNQITPRLMRHFNLLCLEDFNDATLELIFDTIAVWYYSSNKFSVDVQRLAKSLVAATLDTYRTAMKELLPTPSKSHYVFNLRDFSRVIQGCLMVKPSENFGREQLVRLWTHESMRVFGDRLTEDVDRNWFLGHVKTMVDTHFSSDFNDTFSHLADDPTDVNIDYVAIRRLFFGEYMSEEDEDKPYEEVPDREALSLRMTDMLSDFNSNSRKPMSLVMFMFAIEHVSRICRVLKMPGGNALLVGVGGSGRQSNTILATHIVGYSLFQITIAKNYGMNEWREDLKTVLRTAGTGTQDMVFLFSDNQIKTQSMVEDLNNMLNSGEVPNIFPADERSAICESVRPFAKADMGKAANDMTPNEMYAYFVGRIKAHLHIVLAFSPIGDAFRERLRLFPSLINCCAIDWFTAWPEDALQAVANQFLSDIKLDDESVRAKLVTTCQTFHTDASVLGGEFQSELNRIVYVTPTSYLELIMVFKQQLASQREKVNAAIKRYKNGLEQIAFATKSVNEMQDELTAKQPVLKKAQEDTSILMEQVQAKLPGVEKKQKEVGLDAAAAQKKADEVGLVAADVKADLSAAIPALESAVKALDTIKPNDIAEVKKLAKPPYGVKLVCEAVCVMFGLKAVKVPDPEDPTKKIMDFWPTSQKMMGESTFIESLKTFDKDNMDLKCIEEIRKTYMVNEKFTPEAAKKASNAAAGMCQWVYAMETYERIAKVVGPKRAALAEAEAKLAVTMGELNGKKAELKAVEDDLQELQDKFNEGLRYSKELEDDVTLCALKLERATQLIQGLGGEKTRWETFVEDLGVTFNNLTGDVMVSAGVLAYLGPFTSRFRDKQLAQWVQLCKKSGIPASAKPTLSSTLGEPVRIQQWNVDGLPVDQFSVDNGIVVFNARRWPLLIDPQVQANGWIRKMEIPNGLKVIKLSDDNYLRILENAIQFGTPVMLENVMNELDPSLEPLLLKQLFKQSGAMCIKIGDSTVEYNPDFRFYITTKLRNPHYLPEVSVKITLINFMITPEGLEDQLLGVVVATERPDLQEKAVALIVESAQNAKALKEIEDNILEILSGEGNILEDVSAIAALKESSVKSEEIKLKQAAAKEVEAEILKVREGYRPVAFSTQVLFFCISDLAAVEPTYQYSLRWFTNLFVASIKNSEKSKDMTERMKNLDGHFTLSLYRNVCRSLLEKDKLVFSFLLTIKILEGKGGVDANEWYFLLTGGVGLDNPHRNPAPEWLSDKQWGEVCRLSDLEKMDGFREDFQLNVRKWRTIYDSVEPHTMPLPGEWEEQVSSLERLCCIRCVRPDKVVLAVQNFVIEAMGKEFVSPPVFDLALSFGESSCTAPLVFILSKGSDPTSALIKLSMELRKETALVSLGQGQGPIAERALDKAKSEGSWAVLQNCHLAPSWMSRMEKICEELSPETCHADFRVWCTTYPSDVFPSAVLQNGVKMTMEPPKGLRANLGGSFALEPIASEEFYSSCDNGNEEGSTSEFDKALIFRRLMFGLAFFHAILQERRLYGPLGWNIPYEFNESDLKISLQQLSMFLLENDKIPFKALRYTVGECNYGGRVTDDKDRICLNTILNVFYSDEFLVEGSNITPSGLYKVPKDGGVADYQSFIDGLPIVAPPEVFGLDDNATLTKDQNETTAMFSTILVAQGGGGGGGGGGGAEKDAAVDTVAADVLSKLPAAFDMAEAEVKYPVMFEESMNTVLCQELVKYNRLINKIKGSLVSVRKAIKGLVVMSAELDELSGQLFFGKIPALWLKVSYGSLKPLAGYYNDLLKRIEFFEKWLKTAPPVVFWLSGFFFTHAFTTGAKQNFARRYTIPIDAVDFDQVMLTKDIPSYTKKPKDGVYTHGLFFEGGRWNKKTEHLDERLPKVLFSQAPLMWFVPMKMKDIPPRSHYNCPVYKTSDRRGILATTGHSTNFVCFIRVPIPEADTQAHWVMRGCAMLTQLDD